MLSSYLLSLGLRTANGIGKCGALAPMLSGASTNTFSSGGQQAPSHHTQVCLGLRQSLYIINQIQPFARLGLTCGPDQGSQLSTSRPSSSLGTIRLAALTRNLADLKQGRVKDRQQADKDRQEAAKDRQQAAKDREKADKDREKADKDRQHADKDREKAMKSIDTLSIRVRSLCELSIRTHAARFGYDEPPPHARFLFATSLQQILQAALADAPPGAGDKVVAAIRARQTIHKLLHIVQQDQRVSFYVHPASFYHPRVCQLLASSNPSWHGMWRFVGDRVLVCEGLAMVTVHAVRSRSLQPAETWFNANGGPNEQLVGRFISAAKQDNQTLGRKVADLLKVMQASDRHSPLLWMAACGTGQQDGIGC